MSLRPPSGTPPPVAAVIEGRRIDLVALAAEVCERYGREHPDELERYGPAVGDWCRHDNQWLLCWAANDVLGATDIGEQASWLARVLHARGFPVSRLARDLQIAADVVVAAPLGDAGAAMATRLRSAAATVSALDLGAAG